MRKSGFVVDDEENSVSVRCIAAPVYNAQGETVAALGTSTTILQLDESHLPKVVELVKDAARKVLQQFGFFAK